MDINNVDLRLKLSMDSYLMDFEAFKFIDALLKKYNELDSVKKNNIINFKDLRFYNKYRTLYQFLSVVE